MAPLAGKKKHRGLGSFLSPRPTTETTVSGGQQLPVAPPSDTHNTASRENTHITPIENHGQVPDVSAQRNLAVNERTGEVLDDDTGEVLTVTTTTTTVTKTETRRSRSPQPPTNGDVPMVEAQTVKETTTQQFLDPSSAAQISSTATTSQPSQSSEDVSPQTYSSITTYDGSLQRNDSNPWPLPRENAAPKSAIENLKSAAAGLHDVRDSLRGTNFNDVRDSLRTTNLQDVRDAIPLPRRNPARASRSQQVPPVPTVPTIKSPTPPRRSPAPARSPAPPMPVSPVAPAQPPNQSHWQAPWPEPEEDGMETERLRKRKSLSSMPASFSPESSAPLHREKSPRLFKRAKNKKMAA